MSPQSDDDTDGIEATTAAFDATTARASFLAGLAVAAGEAETANQLLLDIVVLELARSQAPQGPPDQGFGRRYARALG